MDITYLSPASVEVVADVMRRVFGEAFEEVLQRRLSDVLTLTGVGGRPANYPLVMSVDADLVGAIILHTLPNRGFLWGLGVVKDHREKRLATALIREAIIAAVELCPDEPIYAVIEVGSVWGKKAYEQLGFELLHENRIPGYHLLQRLPGAPIPPPVVHKV